MSLADYTETIRSLQQCPVTVLQRNWEKFNCPLLCEVFNNNEYIDISRNDIIKEECAEKKILKTIMWGYPRSWPSRTMTSVIDNLQTIAECLTQNKDDALAIKERIRENCNYIGWATISKLLFFFDCKCNGLQCLILDSRVRASAQEFDDFNNINMSNQNNDTYERYLEIAHNKSQELEVQPSQIEFFLFKWPEMRYERLP